MGLNNDLRRTIVHMIKRSGEGHIPSSFSIVDIIDHLYGKVLKFDAKRPDWDERDFFILSKGHGAAGLFVVLQKYGFLTEENLLTYSTREGILGGHPDTTMVPGAEASTGSLGHGFPFAAGVALGHRIRNKPNRVFALMGDGESNEGTIWETGLVAAKQQLGNLVGIVDLNGSAAQILPMDPLADKWRAFGWETYEIDGHSKEDLDQVFNRLSCSMVGKPKMIIAKTVKGKGVSFMETHGPWHHKIPNDQEMALILEALK
ncbi:MAG: transketolase [Fibrobacterota bacterium]|nr:transketolase [Fibrobacterota bacterium]